MKALSIRQPWADLIACGEKSVEVRSWKTNYTGPLLIVSSYARGPHERWAEQQWGYLVNNEHRLKGHALAIVHLHDCFPMNFEATIYARTSTWNKDDWGWDFLKVKKINPFHVKGRQGLFNVVVPLENMVAV